MLRRLSHSAPVRWTLAIWAAALLGACAVGDTPPASPTGLAAAAGNRSVTLSWQEVDKATSYTLYWSSSPEVDPRKAYRIDDVQSPYGHAPLENGKAYYYRLAAANGNGASRPSVETSATPSATATAAGAPASVIAVAESGKVTVSWGQVPFASGYTIYRDTISGVYPGNGTEIANVQSPYADTGLVNGQTYYYVVTALRDGKTGLPSAEVSATPGGSTTASAPQNVTATPGNGAVTLSWSAVSGATGYTVYWSTTSPVTPSTGTALTAAASPTTHSGLQNGTPYYYVVTATVAGKESAASTQVSATPSGGSTAVPSAPTGLSATAGNGQVSLSWSAVSGATGYTLYWSTASSVSPQSGTAIAVSQTSYTHSGLQNGTPYYYVVTAKNAAGSSPASAVASATPSGGSTPTLGSFSSSLSGGAYAIALLENTHQGKGIIQLMVYSADPTANPPGQPVSGLSVQLSGAASGSLPPSGTAGTYGNITPGLLTPGTYTFSVSGSVSGSVQATVSTLATCAVTAPQSGTAVPAGKDLTLKWTSKNSQKAQILLSDAQGKVTYPPLTPDPGGVIVPGKDIPYKGALEIVVSAVWRIKNAGGGIIFMGDGHSKVQLY